MWLYRHMLLGICGSAGADESRFSVARLRACATFLCGVMAVRRVWLVALTLFTVAFIALLIAISIREHKPSVWLSDREIDKLVNQEMRELRLLPEEVGAER